MSDAAAPIFLIGSPRSGSTLLSRMLGAHSQVHAPEEPHLITPLAHLGYYARVGEAPYDPIISEVGIRQVVAALPGGEADYVAALRAYSDRIYGGLLAGTGCTRLLDKTPAYALVLEFLEKLYPDARCVVLTRHPIAVWTSQVESFFDGDFEAAQAVAPLLERYVPAIGRFLRETQVPHVHVRYEELVQDPPAQLRRIAEFLELPFEEAMVEYGSAGGAKESARGLGDPTTVAREQRATTSSLARWAGDLAGRPAAVAYAQRLLEGLLDEDLASWGFERAEIQRQLSEVDVGAEVKRTRPLTRYALERRLLVLLRRNIHRNAFGKLVKRIRWACDVLLR